MLTSAVGDMASITIPITYIEPTSFLQRLSEPYLHSYLLDQAADASDEFERLALIAAFAISGVCNSVRLYKPFNPLLGETFEYVRDGEHGFKFIAEQVSHHPPIAATHAHNDKWEMWDEKRFSSKFGGNSLTMTPLGTFHLVLKSTDEHFTWDSVTCTVNNVIVGSMWVEHHGSSVIRNLKTGAEAHITLEKSGWLSRSRYDAKASIQDADGAEQLTLSGKWTESLTLHQRGKPDRVVWKAEPNKPNKYGFSAFAEELNRISDVRTLPATDSRVRADRMWLEKGEMDKAGAAKKTLENKQREAKKLRTAANKNWIPRFFVPAESTTDDPNEWQFNGRYWAIRERRLKELEDAKHGKAAAATAAAASSSALDAVKDGKSPRGHKHADAPAAADAHHHHQHHEHQHTAAPAAADDEAPADGAHSDNDESLTGTDDEGLTPRSKTEKKKAKRSRRKAAV